MAVLADRLALNQTPFVSMVNGDVYIYSAIARKSSNHSFFDVISLNGWEYSPLRKSTYNCCLYYDDNVQSAPLLDKLHWNFVGHAKLETKQFQCPNPRHTYHKLPLAISLTLNKCPDEKTVVVPVETPYKVNNTRADNLAVCTKLAFGNLSASKMIEWFEVQKLLGVSKTMTYTHKLNADAMKVLEHYKSEGLAEYYPFELPGTERFRRSVGVKNFQSWNDEQVVVLDCQARLVGYTFLGLYDMDEFVIPKNVPTLLDLLKRLRKAAPRAAGFTFKTEIYATTWGRMDTDHRTDLLIGQYLNRTVPMRDRLKSIIITDRVIPGKLSTHGFWPCKDGFFTKLVVPETFATIKHYRSCRKEWLKKGGDKCYRNITRITDISMLKWAKKIENNVRQLSMNIFSSDHG